MNILGENKNLSNLPMKDIYVFSAAGWRGTHYFKNVLFTQFFFFLFFFHFLFYLHEEKVLSVVNYNTNFV